MEIDFVCFTSNSSTTFFRKSLYMLSFYNLDIFSCESLIYGLIIKGIVNVKDTIRTKRYHVMYQDTFILDRKERTETIGRDKDNIKDHKQIWTDKDKTRQNYPYSTSHTDKHLNMPHLNQHSISIISPVKHITYSLTSIV